MIRAARRAAAVCALFCLLLTGITITAMANAQTQDTQRPIATIALRVGDSVAGYIAENGLDARHGDGVLNAHSRILERDVKDEGPPAYFVARADAGGAADPGGLAVLYDHPTCPLALPPGRQLKVGHIGGYVSEIELILPLTLLHWEEMQAAVTAMIAMLDGAGWARTKGRYGPDLAVNARLSHTDFAEKTGAKWARVGHWAQCDAPGIKAYLEVRHVNSMSAALVTPPAVIGTDPEDGPDSFLLRLQIAAEYKSPPEREMTRLRNARRSIEGGGAGRALPLSVWLDDPAWRPEGWVGRFLR